MAEIYYYVHTKYENESGCINLKYLRYKGKIIDRHYNNLSSLSLTLKNNDLLPEVENGNILVKMVEQSTEVREMEFNEISANT